MSSLSDETQKLRERVAKLESANRSTALKWPTTVSKRKEEYLEVNMQNARIEVDDRNPRQARLKTQVDEL